jgi:hypothetical protein
MKEYLKKPSENVKRAHMIEREGGALLASWGFSNELVNKLNLAGIIQIKDLIYQKPIDILSNPYMSQSDVTEIIRTLKQVGFYQGEESFLANLPDWLDFTFLYLPINPMQIDTPNGIRFLDREL